MNIMHESVSNQMEEQTPAMATPTHRFHSWIIALGCVLLLGGILTAYFGPQTLAYFKMLRAMRQPWWSETPQPLADVRVSTAPGTTLSYFGYRFEAPWVGIEKEENEGRWSHVFFRTGQEILVTNPDYSQGDVTDYGHTTPGSQITGSKYEHLQTALSMTPSRLSPFRSHRNFARDQEYMEIKGLLLEHSGAVDIFSVQTQMGKGFEISGLSYNREASIILFDAADREFQIHISERHDSQSELEQADINRVIQSFAPTSSQVPPLH
jgi:hypothetical protein